MTEEKECGAESRHPVNCPLCLFTAGVREVQSRYSGFFSHMLNARIEVLQAVKSLVDQQISCLERQKRSDAGAKKATKIEVE